ncbi:unnamed protein product [Sphenostylis stenocarpa]|uniref:Uncharacterized protein n=1 Tax=Sphenostylis stenocarpa TaxID=92480 RepID=A0AA86TR56_9FABA|nr:unnamed protein product [Sphenostylis stenocarpa]
MEYLVFWRRLRGGDKEVYDEGAVKKNGESVLSLLHALEIITVWVNVINVELNRFSDISISAVCLGIKPTFKFPCLHETFSESFKSSRKFPTSLIPVEPATSFSFNVAEDRCCSD